MTKYKIGAEQRYPGLRWFPMDWDGEGTIVELTKEEVSNAAKVARAYDEMQFMLRHKITEAKEAERKKPGTQKSMMSPVQIIAEEARKKFYTRTGEKNEVPHYSVGQGYIDITWQENNNTISVKFDAYDTIEEAKRGIHGLVRPVIDFLATKGYYIKSGMIEDAFGDVEYPGDHTGIHLLFGQNKYTSPVNLRVVEWTGRSYNDEKELHEGKMPW